MEDKNSPDLESVEADVNEILENETSEKTQCECDETPCDDKVDEEEEIEDEMKMFKNRKAEIKELKEENECLKDKLLRTIAEYDNFRKRTIKEKEGIYADACGHVLKEMLPVLDNLERALTIEGSSEDLKKGVELTVNQFKGSLEKLGVEEIATDGDFDPNFHNAVMHVEDENVGKNQVVEVFQKGYKKDSKVLRHSMVRVAN